MERFKKGNKGARLRIFNKSNYPRLERKFISALSNSIKKEI